MFLWLLTLYLKVEPMAPFLFLHHYMDATIFGKLLKGISNIRPNPLETVYPI